MVRLAAAVVVVGEAVTSAVDFNEEISSVEARNVEAHSEAVVRVEVVDSLTSKVAETLHEPAVAVDVLQQPKIETSGYKSYNICEKRSFCQHAFSSSVRSAARRMQTHYQISTTAMQPRRA